MSKAIQFPPFLGVIFDMDGLVLDTEITYHHAWKKSAATMGYHFTDDFCLSLSGLHFHDVEKKITAFCGTGFDLMQFNRLSSHYWQQYVNQQGISIKKGFFQLLDRLDSNNIPYCLATNSRQINALECLKLANLSEVFKLVVSRDQVKQGKPAPDVFFAAAELLTVPITHCLVLEDSLTGIKAAVNAEAPSVFIPSVFPIEESTVELADYTFNDMGELAEIIQFD